MLVSTKGRYALCVMLDLAQNSTGQYIVLMDIAHRQNISEKYLESILATLSKCGLVSALRGRGGGYKLSREPDQYSVGCILKAVEGSLSPVSILDTPNISEHSAELIALPMWNELNNLIDNYLENITLEDLITQNNAADNYVI